MMLPGLLFASCEGARIDVGLQPAVIVTGVLQGWPAHKAGVRQGQILVAVDGVRVAGQGLDDIHALIKGPVGSRLQLSLENDFDPEGVSSSGDWLHSVIASPLRHSPPKSFPARKFFETSHARKRGKRRPPVRAALLRRRAF